MRKSLIISLVNTLLLLSTPAFAQSVDILWQGNTYTPPFYPGKTLWSEQSVVTFVAMPQGLGDSDSLNYKWIKNGTVLGSISGVGRNTMTYQDTIFSKPQTVRVEIIGEGNIVKAESSITIVPAATELLIYENNPLLGYLFHREVGESFKLDGDEVTFSSFPLFAAANNRSDSGLSYKWSTNGIVGDTGHSITYRIPEDEEGVSRVNLSFSNTRKIIEGLTRDFLVQFGNE